MKSLSALTGFVLALLAFAPNLSADSFTLTRLPLLATGLNNADQLVGYTVGGEFTGGLLYSQGTISTIEVPGSMDTLAFGINNSGQITGYYDAEFSGTHGFVYTNGQFTSFDVPGSVGATFAEGINDSGEIAGFIEATGGPAGFLYDGSSYRMIRVPGARSTYATGLNNAGDVVGYYYDVTGAHAFLYTSQGVLTTFDVPSSTATLAFGINNLGDISGDYETNGYDDHAFLYKQGEFITVNAPDAVGGFGINDSDQVILSDSASFLATPNTVPEPGSFALMLAGFAAAGAIAKRRSHVVSPRVKS